MRRGDRLMIIFLVLAILIFPFPSAAATSTGDDECTQESLERSYGYFFNGPRLGVGPQVAVGLILFDGAGGLTAQDTLNTNGMISRRTGAGSYTVNPNCFGSATLDGDFAGLTFDFMIVPGTDGREFSFVITNAGTIQTGFAMRTGDQECSLASLQGTYRILAPSGVDMTFAAVGFRIFDGAGLITTREDTISTNGVITHRIGGPAIYTVSADCTAQLTVPGAAIFEGVIVAGGSEAYLLQTNPAPGTGRAALLKKQFREHDNDGH